MKKLIFFILGALLITSCATKIPYTEKVRDDFDLSDEKLKQVQFYTSRTIILERSGDQETIATTGQKGDLQVSKTSSSERIVIPANRPCIFEKRYEDGAIGIRFEAGDGRILRFKKRPNTQSDRYYLEADWQGGRGELDYGGMVYHAVSGSSSAYIIIKLKQNQKNKRKDRVVKGMKVS